MKVRGQFAGVCPFYPVGPRVSGGRVWQQAPFPTETSRMHAFVFLKELPACTYVAVSVSGQQRTSFFVENVRFLEMCRFNLVFCLPVLCNGSF